MSTRRDFVRIASTGIAGLAGVVSGSRVASATSLTRVHGESDPSGWVGALRRPPSIEPLGVQLYTVRSLMAEDVPGTLEAVSRIGYREVEFAGLFDTSPEAMKRLLDDLGLTAISSHIALDRIREDPVGVLDEAEALGLRYVTCPSVGRNEMTPEGLGRLVDDFNRFGEASHERGVTFAYHNHDFEFPEIGGVVPYDRLLAECDAELVKMQLDVFWVTNAGRDPVAYLRSHPGRFPMIHAKDRTASGDMVDVGEGQIDFPGILAEAETAGLGHWIVEHDNPDDPMASLTDSYTALTALAGR
jgi:sugar phosphate isomerase/epimerase